MQGNLVVKKIILRRLKRRAGEQIIADLPNDRLKEETHLLIVVWASLVHLL